MASSGVMAGSDLARLQATPASASAAGSAGAAGGGDPSKPLAPMNMDDFIRSICSGEGTTSASPLPGGKTVEEVWREISAGRKLEGPDGFGEMTLEDYLAKAGAVMEEEVRVPSGTAVESGLGMLGIERQVLGFGSDGDVGRGGRGRGRKRLPLDPEDRAALQRQRRMIKNRESAARSRERKQAYTAELEVLVTQLEEEHSQLLNYLEEEQKKRYTQLMERVIPVTEQKKPRRPLRRTSSMGW